MVKYATSLSRESIVNVKGVVIVPIEPIKGMTQQVKIQVRKHFCINRAISNLPINIEDAAQCDEEFNLQKTKMSIEFQLHLLSNQEEGSSCAHQANARVRCAYFPVIEDKENIDRIMEKMDQNGYDPLDIVAKQGNFNVLKEELRSWDSDFIKADQATLFDPILESDIEAFSMNLKLGIHENSQKRIKMAKLLKFSKVFMELEDGLELFFTDKRHFFKVCLLQDPKAVHPISEFGPDALLEPLQVDEFVDALSRKKTAIKTLFLEQSFVSGIGNWIFDAVHSFTGLNWWASIALTTVLTCEATGPLLINQMKASAKLNIMRPELEKLNEELNNQIMDSEFIQEGQKRMKALFKKHEVTVLNVLSACLGTLFLDCVNEIHWYVVSTGLQINSLVPNALVAAYTKGGCFDSTKHAFNGMEMKTSALRSGEETHCFALKANIAEDTSVGSSIIDMYTKCESMDQARSIFNRLHDKDNVSWNVMITGYGVHGCASEAIELLGEMQEEGFKPNEFTYIIILMACNHAGMVEEGQYFKQMRTKRVALKLEHYASVADLLGNDGKLNDVVQFIEGMPKKPDAIIWSSLLGALLESMLSSRELTSVQSEEHLHYSELHTSYRSRLR